MKCFAAILLLVLFAVAYAAEQPDQLEKIEQPPIVDAANAARDKRGVLLSYSSPISYSPYTAPIAYSSSYSVPYAYRTYPYYYSSYYLG